MTVEEMKFSVIKGLVIDLSLLEGKAYVLKNRVVFLWGEDNLDMQYYKAILTITCSLALKHFV